MPKPVTKETRSKIIAEVKKNGNKQTAAARKFGVSVCFVHYLVNNRPIRRTAPSKNICPITGFAL